MPYGLFRVENNKKYGYDKVIMLAGGVGFAKASDAQKDIPEAGDIIVVLGGDNYRIGMGGGAVSSVATGEFGNDIELNAVQRANPEMQKRVANAIRSMTETSDNPIVSIHDHGAGGHLNSLSELVEDTGARININKLRLTACVYLYDKKFDDESCHFFFYGDCCLHWVFDVSDKLLLREPQRVRGIK